MAPGAKRHKVLYFIPNLQQGGAERQILELMTRLPERFETTLCLYEDVVYYSEYLPPGEPRHILHVNRMGPVGLGRFVEVLRQEQPTILHAYRDKANFWARLGVLGHRVPIVLTACRNRQMAPMHLVSEPLLSRLSDRVLTNSEGVRRELMHRARVQPERIQVIHNFLDFDKFHMPTPDMRRAARERFGLADDEVAMLLPGRISLQKHQLGLAVAIHLLQRRGVNLSRVRVLLAGRERDRFVVALLPRLMSTLSVEDYMDRMGPVKEMVTLYHAADFLVMPSLYEGLSNAVLESHACGLPAVVSRAANIDEIVLEGESGFEVPTFAHRQLADAIERMLALDTETRIRMGQRGRAHVEQKFSTERVLAEFIELYDRLLEEKSLA